MASVPYGDSFLLVGGFDWENKRFLSTVLVFDRITEEFRELPGVELSRARTRPTAMFVDPEVFPKCD